MRQRRTYCANAAYRQAPSKKESPELGIFASTRRLCAKWMLPREHMGLFRGLSAEHYMSRSVLEALGDTVAIGGAPWLGRGEQREIGINKLTAKILCSRHNTALFPADTAAGEFFEHCGRSTTIFDANQSRGSASSVS